MISAIKNMIKRVSTTRAPYDAGILQVTDCSYMGKKVTTQVFHDYGFVSSVPVDGTGFCLNPRGEEGDRISMFFHPKHTVKNLKEGEVVVGNFYVEATLYFNEQGQAVLTLPDDLIINCNNLTATVRGSTSINTHGNVDLQTDGSTNITSSGNTTLTTQNFSVTATVKTTITSPEISLNGVVSAAQGMDVTGSMENNGVDIGSGHKHDKGTYKDSLNGNVSGNSGDPI